MYRLKPLEKVQMLRQDCQNDVTKLGLKTVAGEGCFFTMRINVSSVVRGQADPSQTTREVADLSLLQDVFAVRLVVYPHAHDKRFLAVLVV